MECVLSTWTLILISQTSDARRTAGKVRGHREGTAELRPRVCAPDHEATLAVTAGFSG